MKNIFNRAQNKEDRQINAQTAAYLTQTIDRELSRGMEADEQLILECVDYLQELSPKTAVSPQVTEKYLQAELKNHRAASRRRSAPLGVKIALRLATVLVVLAMFCAALPVMAVYIESESDPEEGAIDLPKPIVELLTYSAKQNPIDYQDPIDFKREVGYSAVYSDTEEMLNTELPPDILCLNGLPESFGSYEVTVKYIGQDYPGNTWYINWKTERNNCSFSAIYRKNAMPMPRYSYEIAFDTHISNGRTFYCKELSNGQYRALYIQKNIYYTAQAPDYETLTLLLDHTVCASEIIPSASDSKTPSSAPDTQVIALLPPEQYGYPDRYTATYDTTAEFIENEKVNILVIDDAAEDLGNFWVEVIHHPLAEDSYEWKVRCEDTSRRWSFNASAYLESQEFRRAEYEAVPDFFELYTVGDRTYFIFDMTQYGTKYNYLVNYFEANVVYSINVNDRDIMMCLLDNLVKAEDLIAP